MPGDPEGCIAVARIKKRCPNKNGRCLLLFGNAECFYGWSGLVRSILCVEWIRSWRKLEKCSRGCSWHRQKAP